MNIVNDAMILKDKSEVAQFYNSYLEAHPNEKSKAALNTAMKLLVQVGVSGIAGAVSGGITSGTKMASAAAPLMINKAAESKTSRPYKNNTEDIQRLAEYINKNQISANTGAQGVSRAEMAAQNVLNKIKAGEEPADSDINELVNVAVNDKNLIDQAIHNGLSQNPESQAYAIASRLEDKRYKNKPIFSNELKELVLSRFSMEEKYNNENGTEPEIKFSVGYTENNKPVAIIDNDILYEVPESEWSDAVKEQLKKVKSIEVGKSTITINKTTRNEYLHSKYSQMLKSKEHSKYADKLRVAGNIKDVVIATTDYINEAPKHNNFDNFARGSVLLQIGNSQYEAEVVVGITSAGNAVLYDIVDINKTDFDIKKVSISSAANKNAAPQIEGYAHNNSISENNSVVNSNFMQETENDANRAAFEATTVSIDIIHREYAGYTKEQIYALKRVGKAFNVDVFIGSDKNFSPNGYYVRAHNGERAKIYLNAGGTNPLNAVIRHEIMHHIKAKNIEAYNAFCAYITERYKAKHGQEAFDTALAEIAETYKTKTGKELTYDEILEEFCADVGMDMFRSPEEARKFAFENRKLAERILDAVREVLRKISSVFRNEWDYSFDRLSSLESTAAVGEDGEVYHSHRTASESLNAFDVETLKEAERVLVEALKNSSDNGTKNSFSEKLKTIAKSFGIENFNDYINVQKRVFESLQDKGFFTDDGGKSKTVINKNSGMKIEINKKSIKETFSEGSKYEFLGKEKKFYKLHTIQYIDKLIENAVLLKDNTENYHNEESSVKYGYLSIDIEIEGKPVQVIMDIRKSPQKNLLWVHQIYTKENTEIVSHWSQSSKMGSINLGTDNSITEKGSNVNTSNDDVEEKATSESLISIEDYNKNSEYIPSNKKAQDIYNRNLNAMLRKAESFLKITFAYEILQYF